ncbi:hypothetical protein ACFWRZ_08690 [Streptomyces rubiginosohelvolus]|uniref:hypothetical protein n=1 Tax=Streptomyces rubiginosohelvolus TaxID=67362 RepID=UPI00364D2813
MFTFLLGLLLGALSGIGTHLFTGDPQLGAIVGVIAAVVTWLGIAVLVFCTD